MKSDDWSLYPDVWIIKTKLQNSLILLMDLTTTILHNTCYNTAEINIQVFSLSTAVHVC